MMITRLALPVVALLLASAAPPSPQAADAICSGVTALAIPDVTIDAAIPTASGAAWAAGMPTGRGQPAATTCSW